ncbi:hypothetical protein [Vibrio halioticoli]|uniref:hypothetical protein n=1 Tax=Vibrio halioticoli TaxID=71388 RepID=UPI000587E0F9|nr:hypothetical protein [Vibrio halioticoli]
MRYFSKLYIMKINKLLYLATINDLPFSVVLDVLKSRSGTKQDKRDKRRNGERIVWSEASISRDSVAFPLETLKGKRLTSLSV